MIKLIAVDLDGTLLNDQHAISPRNAEAINRAVAQGTKFTMATGRMYTSALPYAKQLGLDVPIITYNGGMIRACLSGETLFHRPISEALAHDILALFRERNWYMQTYIDDVLYVKEINEASEYYTSLAGVPAVPVGDRLFSMPGAPSKMLAIGQPEEIGCMATLLQSRFADSICMAVSNPRYLELTQAGVNKGTALAFLAEQFQIKPEEVMAMGDSQNDLDMLTYAGLGVAMGNAADNIKAAAQAVTSNYDADGVAEAIERYVLR